jgi:hypothetical protein
LVRGVVRKLLDKWFTDKGGAPGTREWYVLVEHLTKCRELILIEKQVGHRWYREYVYRDLIPTKSGPPRTRKDRTLFDPDEIEVVDGQALPRKLWDGDFIKALRAQKRTNKRTIDRSLRRFEWECDQVLPWLEQHSDWTWQDAYNAIVWRDGAFPAPPED